MTTDLWGFCGAEDTPPGEVFPGRPRERLINRNDAALPLPVSSGTPVAAGDGADA